MLVKGATDLTEYLSCEICFYSYPIILTIYHHFGSIITETPVTFQDDTMI